MTPEQLRAMQAPIKARFRENPASAQTVMVARGELDREQCVCRIPTGHGPLVEAGLHEMTGGDGRWKCSAQMLLEALIGCAGTTACVVSTAMGIEFATGRIRAEGQIDFSGTMGVSRDVPVGFIAIRLVIELQTTADDSALAKLQELTERYCVVAQSLRTPVTCIVERITP
ncbi:MAG: OsmC family protein [Planctomycetaceae bacterium]